MDEWGYTDDEGKWHWYADEQIDDEDDIKGLYV